MNAPVKLTAGKPPEVLAFKLPDEERRAEQAVADMFVRQYRKGGGCGDLNVNEIYNFCISKPFFKFFTICIYNLI